MCQGLFVCKTRRKNFAFTKEIHSNGRHFIDHQEALAVCHLHDLFGIGIVGGPEGICADPFQEFKVTDIQCIIKTSSFDITILVLSEVLMPTGSV